MESALLAGPEDQLSEEGEHRGVRFRRQGGTTAESRVPVRHVHGARPYPVQEGARVRVERLLSGEVTGSSTDGNVSGGSSADAGSESEAAEPSGQSPSAFDCQGNDAAAPVREPTVQSAIQTVKRRPPI
ncbi:MAG: hypothetical protein HY875_10520 [Chloroflexi bacterium]|nr:hypothetical protein [Chloroflexota bacterium]